MKKLKLETLDVTSFVTSPVAARERGTVEAHGRPTNNCPLETYSVERCGDTFYFDCTLGCTMNTACPDGCTA